jgi:hypothetical protein
MQQQIHGIAIKCNRGFGGYSTVAGRVGNNVEAVEGGEEAVMSCLKSVKRDNKVPAELELRGPGVGCASEVVIGELFAIVCSG